MGDFDKKYNIVDEDTPPNTPLSGHYKKSFGHYTIRERLPVILTQVIDNVSRDKDEIVAEYGEEAREELKEIIGNISKLKYELQTDKELLPFSGNASDTLPWNIFLSSLPETTRSYFNACWLYAECYMYRRLWGIFQESTYLKHFDYFRKQKQNALTCCWESLETVVKSVSEHKKSETGDFKEFFRRLLKLNLWGNRCDLSISQGKEVKQTGEPYNDIDSLDDNILIDQTADIWDCIANAGSQDQIISIMHDNSGYEVFTDFLIADFIIEQKLAAKVCFYVKAIPWYISDVTEQDFYWTINYLKDHCSPVLQSVGKRWSEHVKDGLFELQPTNCFLTGPYEFYRMPEVDQALYHELAKSQLVIFKGDLNYRKLIGDFNWNKTETFKTCLRQFRPTNLCTLRTIKADLICGLKHGVAEILNKIDPSWMVTGEYGVIQFASKD